MTVSEVQLKEAKMAARLVEKTWVMRSEDAGRFDSPVRPRRILLVSSDKDAAERFARAASEVGVQSEVLTLSECRLQASSIRDAADWFVYLAADTSPDFAAQAKLECQTLLECVALASTPDSEKPYVALVTRGAFNVLADEPTRPLSAVLVGVARHLVDKGATIGMLCDMAASWDEADVATVLSNLRGPGKGRLVAVRAGRCYFPTESEASLSEAPVPVGLDAAPRAAGHDSFVVHLTDPGQLGSVALQGVARVAPGSGEVELELSHASLDESSPSIDLSIVGSALSVLGSGCVGIVRGLGQGVRGGLREGDRVVALWRGSARRFLTLPAAMVAPLPDVIDAATAAVFAPAFTMAAYLLDEVARIRPGDSVLILDAGRPLGYAVGALVRSRGGRVVLESRSQEGIAWLRSLGETRVLDSSSPMFLRSLVSVPRGDRVNLIVNLGTSLPLRVGEFSVAGAKCISLHPGYGEPPQDEAGIISGRINAAALFLDHPQACAAFLRRAVRLLAEHKLPTARTVSVAGVREALRGNKGEFDCIDFRDAVQVEITPERLAPSRIRSNASYWIVGGTSPLGIEVAKWAVTRGARSLLLLASDPLTREAKLGIDFLKREGAQVRIASLDANIDELKSLNDSPVRGVFHLLGLVREAYVDAVGGALTGDSSDLGSSVGNRLAADEKLLTLMDGLDFFLVVAPRGTPSSVDSAASTAFWESLASGVDRTLVRVLASEMVTWWDGFQLHRGALETDEFLEVLGEFLRSSSKQVAIGTESPQQHGSRVQSALPRAEASAEAAG